MTTVRRLNAVSAVVLLAAIATCTHVWGEPSGDKGGKLLTGRIDPPGKVERPSVDDLSSTKFSKKPIIVYETTKGDRLFAFQVQPKLDPVPRRDRDILILVDTSASQARGGLAMAQKLTEALLAAAGKNDRIAIWTVNTPNATLNLTRGFEPNGSARLKDALAHLAREVPFGASDLKAALEKSIVSFENLQGRQRVLVMLGSGKSVLNPIANADRNRLAQLMVDKQIALFSVPLGSNMEPTNLHGLATATGGLLVRVDETPAATVAKLNAAFEAPILYPRSFQLAPVAESFPARLPPVRSDAPTLVVGKLNAGDQKTLQYTLEGQVVGRNVQVRETIPLPLPEFENFFLASMVEQWRVADRRDQPSPFRADRALAMSFERTRLARDEFKAQGEWAMHMDKLDVAAQMFKEAARIDPADPEADAGMKIVAKMKQGLLKREQLADALGKPEDPAIRIQKGTRPIRDRLDKLVALAQEDKMDAKPPAGGVADPDFPPDREPFLRVQQHRQAVEEQRITGIVNEAERQARKILANDPETAHDILKRTLASVRDNPDLTPQTRQNLVNRLENALRDVNRQGVAIKRDLDERMRIVADSQARLARIAEVARGEEAIVRRIEAINQLMNTGRYEEAHREALVLQADQIARGLDVKPVHIAQHDRSINAIHKAEQDEIRRASEERYLLTMLQVDKSHIPFPDEPPVGFPPASIWRELTQRRKGLWESIGLGEDAPGRANAEKIRKKLEQPVNLDKGIDANTPLKDALEFLADRYDLTLIIDSKAFEAIGVQKVEEQPVQLPKMVGVSMATVLRLLLAQVKGDVYTGTYLIRRDYIEITTTYNAAAEKVVRAYPVADLVIPIPNSVNIQALQQSLLVLGQYQQSLNPFALGAFQGFGGAVGAAGGNPFNPAGAAALGGGFNPFNFGGGGVGNNQFGNLGGQFGFQGQTTEQQLMQLIVTVIAPGEWAPLNQPPAGPGAAGGPPPGLLGAPGPGMNPVVPTELLNGIDYYAPARALVIRGSSRIHTRLEGGLLGPRPGAAPVMGGLGVNRDGALAIAPKGGKDAPAVAKGPTPQPAPNKDVKTIDPATHWQQAIAKLVQDPKADHTGLVIATTDFLVQNRKFDHAAEFIKAALRHGVAARPWMYEALGIALQLSGGSPDEIERAQVSAVDVDPQDARGFLRAAQAMANLNRPDRALAFCKQAAMLQPNVADPYANSLVYALNARDPEAMAWAATNLLRQEWPVDNDDLHNQARTKVADLARALEQNSRRTDASNMVNKVQKVRERDLVVNLRFQGDADFDLKVKEPIGTVCSYLQRQTPAGGTLLADNLANLTKQQYVAAEAYSGEYEVFVEHIWGRPLGGKVTLEVIRHQGTANEHLELHTLTLDPSRRRASVKLTLDNGRRTTVAVVPPPAAAREPNRQDKTVTPDQTLTKLRALVDPNQVEVTGLHGGSTGRPMFRPTVARPLPTAPTDPTRVPTYQRVQSFVGNAIDMTSQTTVMPERGEVRIRLNPVFQSVSQGQGGAPVNPLIPGGF